MNDVLVLAMVIGWTRLREIFVGEMRLLVDGRVFRGRA